MPGLSRPGRETSSPQAGEYQVRPRPQNSRYLSRGRATGDLDDQVEEVVGIWQRAGLAHLERNPPLGVETNPGACLPHQPLGWIDAADPGRRKLASEEEHRLAIATADYQGALGHRHVEDRGGEWRQRGDMHCPDDRKRDAGDDGRIV